MIGDDGWIRVVDPKMDAPSLKDNRADVDRLIKGLEGVLKGDRIHMGFDLVRKAPTILREQGYNISAALYRDSSAWHVIDLWPPSEDSPVYGLAMDLGSSTIVLRLLDLVSGDMKGEASFLNPQIDIGPDILTRIHFAAEKGGLKELQGLLINRLNAEIARMTEKLGIDSHSILGISAAGNTTMTHLFLGLNPYWICREPYIPVINKPPLLTSSELGLGIHPRAPVLVFPNVGSYFGGDLIAGIIASGMTENEAISILMDVGTNAEVVLGNRDWLVACAGAAGPALEGGVAGMGMMAGPGVIDQVSIHQDDGVFDLGTIDDLPAVGICGSGLIDLMAQLFLKGMIDSQGKFVADKCGERLREIDEVQHLVVVHASESGTGKDLFLSQPDIDALLRSKAAMYTILMTITDMVNISMSDISRFYVAGTFGTTIEPRSAITLGMVPDLAPERFKSLGNTSIRGAGMALLSRRVRDEIVRISDRITYIELNVNQEFMNRFSAAKFIPHTDRARFPSVQG